MADAVNKQNWEKTLWQTDRYRSVEVEWRSSPTLDANEFIVGFGFGPWGAVYIIERRIAPSV